MTRILILLTSLLLAGSPAALAEENGQSFDSVTKKQYVRDKCVYDDMTCVLAISTDGAYGIAVEGNRETAKYNAIRQCQLAAAQPDSCQIVDVNAESDFIKKKLLTAQQATESASTHYQQSSVEELCLREFKKAIFKTEFLDNLGWGQHVSLDYADCAPFFDKDGLTWIGGGGIGSAVYIEKKCFDLFHGPKQGAQHSWKEFIGFDNHLFLNRGDCDQFVSEDYSTWTAPLPEELKGQSVEENQVATIPEPTKAVDPPKTQLPEVVDSQPTEADKNIELEFWQSIKGSDDSDMYRAYLRKFPSGVYAGLAKLKIKKLGGDTQVANASIPNLDYGNYHALVIGNDQYQYLDNLKTPRHDAKLIAATLKRDYGFDVNLISNATRADMFAALEHYRRTSTPQDNLLIYYAGHGVLDQEADEGFWLPVDAKKDSQLNWIPNADIIRSVSSMQAKHVMVVADSCFSGTLIRALTIKQRTPDYLRRLSKKKARVAMTSGSEEPVTDVGGGGNSAFAKAFLTLLDENTGVMDGHSMFTQLRRRVMINTKQTPRYGDMRGHEDGEFLFVRQ
jgi:hypothetical protein